MYFVIEKGSDADVVWHFFICYDILSIIELPTVSLHATSHLGCVSTEHDDFMYVDQGLFYCDSYGLQQMAPIYIKAG